MSERISTSRAEAVRERRLRQNEKRLMRAQKEATKPLPSILQRVKAPKRTPIQNARRRFQLVLPVPRDAIKIPSISFPAPRFGWRLLSFILAALFGTGIYLAFTMPLFRASDIRVNGNQMTTPQEVSDALGVTGQPIFTLKPADLEARLRLNYAELDTVKVTVYIPNVVIVDVTERKPIIRWQQSEGYTWIDEHGIAFRPRGEMSGLIPVAAGSAPPVVGSGSDPLTPSPYIPMQFVQELKQLAPHLPQGTAILYDPNLGFGWSDARGWKVYFGTSADDVDLRVRVYEAMVNSLTQRGIKPALINVTYPDAPYYRLTP